MFQQNLATKINDRSAVVGIYGLGYVGLPLLIRFAEVGIKVVGFDIDQKKVDSLRRGKSYFDHIPDSALACTAAAGCEYTTDFAVTSDVDALIFCVPTPLTTHREPDLSYIESTLAQVLPHLRKGQLLSLESTTYPGTTEEIILPRLEASGFKVGEDFFLVYSPEREDPGNKSFTTKTIPKICGGVNDASQELGVLLYGSIVDRVVPVSSTRAAEMTKLLENIHRSVNIGLVNEMKIVADRMDIDIYEVIRAAATKPFGFTPYYPGPGLGGHCIPIDPFYLTWKAREYGVNTRFIELAGEVNTAMPEWVVSKLAEALNSHRKPVNGSKVLVLGLAYKKNVDDLRESPSLKLIELLLKAGADVSYSDPYFPEIPATRHYDLSLCSVPLTPETIRAQDVLLLATDHDRFDYDCLLEHAALIVDTRGRFPSAAENVVKA
ncbi:MAG: nucleotide sugar dehydrogenase [Pseudomonadales bacterium]